MTAIPILPREVVAPPMASAAEDKPLIAPPGTTPGQRSARGSPRAARRRETM